MPKLYIAISYKGGTGRSVASLNLAYHLQSLGEQVALVDLDLGATSLQHICRRLDSISPSDVYRQHGNQETLGDRFTLLQFLQRGGDVEEIYFEDLMSRPHGVLYSKKDKSRGRMDLFPSVTTDEITLPDGLQFSQRLEEFFYVLGDRYTYVICDLRSGLSTLLSTLLDIGLSDSLSPRWLLFCRFTPQQIRGLRTLLYFILERQSYDNEAQRIDTPRSRQTSAIRVVPTAYLGLRQAVDPNPLARRAEQEFNSVFHELTTMGIPYPQYILPFDESLQWVEGIVTEQRHDPSYFGVMSKLAQGLRKD